MSNLTEKSVIGSFWIFSSKWADFSLRIFATAILARILVPADFGIVQLATMIISFVEMFALVGLESAIIQKSDLKDSEISSAYGISIVLAGIYSLALFGSAGYIADWFGVEELIPIFKLYSLLPIINACSILSQSLLAKQMDFKRIAKIEFISFAMTYVPISLLLAWYGFGFWALIYANFVFFTCRSIFYLSQLERTYIPNLDIRHIMPLVRFGLGNMIARFFNFFTLKGDNFVVGKVLGTASLGFYSKAYNLQSIFVMSLSTVVERVLFSSFSLKQSELHLLADIAYKILFFLNSILLPLTAIFMISADSIIYLMLGDGWDAAIVPFQILVFGAVLRINYKVYAEQIRAIGEIRYIVWIQIIAAILTIILSLIGSKYGISGVATGILITLFGQYILFGYFLSRVNLHWKFLNSYATIIHGAKLSILVLIALIGFNFINGHFLEISNIILKDIGVILIFILELLLLGTINRRLLLSGEMIWGINLILKLSKRKQLNVE